MISVHQTEIDLGQIPVGAAHLFDIVVTNSYNSAVSVGVRFGCGSCTNGGFYPDNNIPAGGNRLLKVKFTPSAKGQNVKSIRLSFLAPGSNTAQNLTIKFKAQVV